MRYTSGLRRSRHSASLSSTRICTPGAVRGARPAFSGAEQNIATGNSVVIGIASQFGSRSDPCSVSVRLVPILISFSCSCLFLSLFTALIA
eukprot:scaffold13220_cov113-Isochrysis_galbana.AAC.4